MATSGDDLEVYLRRLDRRFEKVDEQTYLVSLGTNLPSAVLRIADPVLVIQVDIAKAPSNSLALEAKLFRRLLELNAKDLLHASYGLEDGRIILNAALEIDTLDLGELEGVLADIDLAVSEHVPVLHDIVKQG
jgi:hypothetical protein